jgi:hypothetical protein
LQGRQDEGRGMEMDIDPEIEAMVEKAMTQLRKKLGPDELKVYEFKSADVRIEVSGFDAKITVLQRGRDPLVMVLSQKVCADPNRLANELEVDTFEEVG